MKWLRAPRVPDRIAEGAPLVEAKGVSVELGGRLVLDGVDLAVGAGEMVALVGPNGAGKSTLLHVLTGDRRPIAGTVSVLGEELDEWTGAELALRRSVLPQQIAVSFPFLVDEIVRMGRAPWVGTHGEDEDDDAVAEAMRETEVAHLAQRQFTSLSGGERARVALARVLVQDSQLLLLDEPTAALDIRHQELVMETVGARVARGDGAVVVVHDLNLAAAHADRIAVLAEGKIVADGPPREVLTAPLLSAVYHHEVEVAPHPTTGVPLVLPVRRPRGSANQA